MMVARVQKWGNNQGLRLSKQVLDLADIAVGDDLELIVSKHQITIRKAPGSKYDLGELVARIPKRYRAREVKSGPPAGREEW